MAENLVVNEQTYEDIDSLNAVNEVGEPVMFYPDAVRYVEQNLTPEQKEQAIGNLGLVEVFIVRDDTTFAEVQAADNAKKVCVLVKSGTSGYFVMSNIDTANGACFARFNPRTQLCTSHRLKTDSSWITSTFRAVLSVDGVIADSDGKIVLNAVTEDKLSGAIDAALAQAKASGEFDGKDGEDGQPGKDGTDGQPGKDGSNGKDGVSPTVTVSKSGKVTTVKITDANGTKTATINDGTDGKDGSDGQNGKDGQNGSNGVDGNGIKSAVLNADYTLTLTFDDGTSYTTPSIRGAAGKDGADGKDGQDGAKGDKGDQGIQGIQGEPGTPGEKGDQGPKGDTGETGPKGDKGDTGATGPKGDKGDPGEDYVLTDADKQEIAGMVGAAEIPDYWKTYLDGKIAAIKQNQDNGGKDAVSYIVITDIHYPSNLGKISPALAKYIMDRCNIKFVLILGDVRTRGIRLTEAESEAEWSEIDEMLRPIQGRVLMTQGNHDAGYGKGDYDGDGTIDNYAYEFTPAEMFNRVYRKAGMAGNVHYDASGTAYYIDDAANRTRFILLNSHLNFDGNRGYSSYETVPDGNGGLMAKYPAMWKYRYTQCQYDFLINDALASVPGDDWKVIMGSHVPINQTGEMPEFPVMIGVLQAYKNKTTYNGSYEGTAESGSTENFTNRADTTDENFLDNGWWYNGEIITYDKHFISNYVPAVCPNKNADIIRVAGLDPTQQVIMKSYDANRIELTSATTSAYNDITFDENGIATWKAGYVDNYVSTANSNKITYIRVAGVKLGAAEDIVITVNEEITYTESEGGGYDAVSVNCDFTNAKGNLVAYHGGHNHKDEASFTCYKGGTIQFPIITTRCDGQQENDSSDPNGLYHERVVGTITEQSFDVFTVTPDKIYATKIGAGLDREVSY